MGFTAFDTSGVHAMDGGLAVEVEVRGFARHHSGATGDWAGSDHQGERVAAWVGDVAGWGPDAAVIAGKLRATTQDVVARGGDGLAVARQLDRDLEGHGDLFATFLHCHVRPATRSVSVFQAGHPPPLALASGRYLNSGPNPPLGYLNGSGQAPVAWVLPEGETLLLFSDGLIERRGSSLVTGMERLQTVTQDLGKLPLTALADRVLAQAGTGADDDVTLLALRTTDVVVGDTPLSSRGSERAGARS